MAINTDNSQRIVMDTSGMDWVESPAKTVLRKRVQHIGPEESGTVTSVVQFLPDSQFPKHFHPEGEEIFVLKGTFSDEYGDWGHGYYLLNPDGTSHAPFSKEGCTLLVKLRQYAGTEREQKALQTNDLNWQATDHPQKEQKLLYRQSGFADTMRLERWAPGVEIHELSYTKGAEYYVISGSFSDEFGSYGEGCWYRLPAGFTHRPQSETGCELYLRLFG